MLGDFLKAIILYFTRQCNKMRKFVHYLDRDSDYNKNNNHIKALTTANKYAEVHIILSSLWVSLAYHDEVNISLKQFSSIIWKWNQIQMESGLDLDITSYIKIQHNHSYEYKQVI